MGRRSSTESIARIYRAFLRERTWPQAALAREVGIGVQALRKRLDELTTLGMPLEQQADPPQVFWSVPPSWFPGGAYFPEEDLPDLLHLLWHAPRGRRRERLLRLVLGGDGAAAAGGAILTHEAPAADEAFLPIIEDAMARERAVRMRFYSRERGAVETRHVSVHRVDVGPPARLVATCHRTGTLKWFRVDNIVEVRADESATVRSATDAAIARFLEESLDGFRADEPAEEHAFLVEAPEAAWVEKNLLAPMRAEQVGDGILVTVRTAGALRVARYVIGLGGAATPQSERLRALVEELAKGALRNAAGPRKIAKIRDEVTEPARRRANR